VRSNVTTLKGYLDSLFGIIQAYDTRPPNPCRRKPAALAAIKQREDFDFLHEDIFQLLAESQDGLTRVQDIVQNLKDFSRVGESGFGWADLHACLDSTLNIIWNELKYKCTVVKHYDPTLPQVYCIASQLNQVFMNLLVNAGHAIAEKGEITITTRQTRTARFRWRSATPAAASPPSTSPPLRALLHHQAHRQGHRPRPVDHLRHHRQAQGQHRREQRGGQGHHLHRQSPRRRRRRRRGSAPDALAA
jgi:hypothetical protein